ncbi:hypothetical protein E1B28_007890 [Marasmius oreades]|uniref:Uncharacterized protein n=1 Tax=Marasmius oreades TaxID=181124 RepID=A0A9P7S2K0_9AGAR|nr:uncharacterized protein E1B28_007890 [Marasmius oreades]KAG7094286.1 hypothetical protein E1B28_007890 [Marasmius oreades]
MPRAEVFSLPPISFTSEFPNFSPPTTSILPSHFRALSYDAAVWAWSSQELQEIVSRTIRYSARESSMRLLSLELLDTTLPDELHKLHNQRHTSGQKYRDIVQRRSMLIERLWNGIAKPCNSSPTESLIASASALLFQLSETVVESDKLAEGLVQICDQVKEIQQLLSSHSTSALAVALRKLNKSYTERTEELVRARERISQLEAEREDAWREAEKLADRLDAVERGREQSDFMQEGVQTQMGVEATEAAQLPVTFSPLVPTTSTMLPTIDRLPAPFLPQLSSPSTPTTPTPFTSKHFSPKHFSPPHLPPSPTSIWEDLSPVIPNGQGQRPRRSSTGTSSGYSLLETPGSLTTCTEESTGCWSVETIETSTPNAYAHAEFDGKELPNLPVAITESRRPVSSWSIQTGESGFTRTTRGTPKSHRTGVFISSSPPPLPTASPVIPQTVERPLPLIPSESWHEPQEDEADDSDSDTTSLNYTEEGEEISIQTVEVISLDPVSESRSLSFESFTGVSRTVEKPTLISVPSLPNLKVRASIPLMDPVPQSAPPPVHLQELRVRTPQGPTNVSGHIDDEERYDHDEEQDQKRQLIQQPRIVEATTLLPKTYSNPSTRPPLSKLLIRRGAKSGNGSMDKNLTLTILTSSSSSRNDDSTDIVALPHPSSSVPLPPESPRIRLTTSRNCTLNPPRFRPPSHSPPSHPLPSHPPPSSPSSTLKFLEASPPDSSTVPFTTSSTGKPQSKRYSESIYYQQPPLGSSFLEITSPFTGEDTAEEEAPETRKTSGATSLAYMDDMQARRSTRVSEGSLRLSPRTMDVGAEASKTNKPDEGPSVAASSSTTPRQTIALEEKARAMRRDASVNEMSDSEVDSQTELSPSSTEVVESITHNSFPNNESGGSFTSQQGMKPQSAIRFPRGRVSTGYGSGVVTTTPSEGIIGGPGVRERGFTLNQLGSGIQKWKGRFTSHRSKGNVPSGVFVS